MSGVPADVLRFGLHPPRTALTSNVGVGTVKRLLLCQTLLCCSLLSAPRTASAQLWYGWIVFTFHADPFDPLGGTGTGWFYVDEDRAGRPRFEEARQVDFWWQAQHWTNANTVGMKYVDFIYLPPVTDALVDWGLWGGTEEEYLWGNALEHDFDFSITKPGAATGPFDIGETFPITMDYVNPTASHHAASGQSYIANGTFYFTDQQPPPSQGPAIPEGSSLALLALGVGALIVAKRASA